MIGFVDLLLLGSWTENEFRKRTRVTHNTFIFLYKRLGPYLKEKNTQFRVTVSMQDKIAMLLHQLGSGDELQTIGDLYEVHKSTSSIIVKEFCRVVRKHLPAVFVQTLSESRFRVYLRNLKIARHSLYHRCNRWITYSCFSPLIGGQDDYCRKSSHSAIQQGIVGPDCTFWDYEFGWAENLHDWSVF